MYTTIRKPGRNVNTRRGWRIGQDITGQIKRLGFVQKVTTYIKLLHTLSYYVP
jgi:hypothetical protein